MNSIRVDKDYISIPRQTCKVMTVDKNLISYWLMFINPFFSLSPKEMFLLRALVDSYINISKSCKDEALINQLLFSTENRKKLKSELSITDNYFDVLLNKLREHKVISDNKIILPILPKITEDGNFNLIITFKNEQSRTERN